MTEQSPLLWIGAASAVASIALLRLAWSKRERSVALNGAAWTLLLAGCVLGAAANGAWGIAIVSLFALGMAVILLGHSASTAPAGKAKAQQRRVHMLPDQGEPLRIGGRLLTFLLTVPLALIASMLAALGVRALGGLAGWHDANGNVIALFLVPVLWAILVIALMMTSARQRQLIWLVVPSVVGGIALWLGIAA